MECIKGQVKFKLKESLEAELQALLFEMEREWTQVISMLFLKVTVSNFMIWVLAGRRISDSTTGSER